MASSSQGPATRFRTHRFGAAPVDYAQAGSRGKCGDGESESKLESSVISRAALGKPALPGRAGEPLAVPCHPMLLGSRQHDMWLPLFGRGPGTWSGPWAEYCNRRVWVILCRSSSLHRHVFSPINVANCVLNILLLFLVVGFTF